MTLVGVAVGAALPVGDAIAGVVLVAVGIWMLVDRDEEVSSTLPLIALAVGISVDELAIGVSLGLLGVPLALAVVLVAAQAVVASAAGYALGARVRGDRVERIAAAALLALGIVFIAA